MFLDKKEIIIQEETNYKYVYISVAQLLRLIKTPLSVRTPLCDGIPVYPSGRHYVMEYLCLLIINSYQFHATFGLSIENSIDMRYNDNGLSILI